MNLWYKDAHECQKAETTTKQQKKISEKSLKHHVTPKNTTLFQQFKRWGVETRNFEPIVHSFLVCFVYDCAASILHKG